ncbi:conserved hypothetical protein [Treponema phagedenis]|uniref:Uncharacterized protein n=1 Tax=Treponema phagedenis TaxID=162 RepID=A0A0B7H1A5_TREPH|nr:hypothetical protein HMPREF9554_00174 [Treponema phagedenis F0421]CEM62746.1 conserved hypothetical protein [Treponema phagedenis]
MQIQHSYDKLLVGEVKVYYQNFAKKRDSVGGSPLFMRKP